jgi:hypothetical protein
MYKRLDLRRVYRPLAAFTCAVSLLGCGGERFIVVGTARAPSTAGFVEAHSAGQGARIDVHMEQLQKVDNVDPNLHAYVVWFEPPQGKAMRAGSLRYKPDDRTGELQARSPFRKFVVKITAEANDKPNAPGAFVVATQEISVD